MEEDTSVAIGKLLRTLTVNHGAMLIPHLEAYAAAGKFPKTWDIQIVNYKEKDEFYHPSSHCFMPPIDLWRYRKGQLPSRPISAALRRTFDCGHMWHGYIQAMLLEMGFVMPENVERTVTHTFEGSYGPATARGTIDLFDVAIPGQHTPWLIDIKTMSKPEFESGPREQTWLKWEAQVNCYMDWMNVDEAMILAVCKDSPHDFREYKVQRNPELVQEIYDRWSYVEYCLREKITPDDSYEVDPLLLNPGDSVLDAEVAK